MILLSFSKTVSSDPGCEIWASTFLCACKCSVWKKRERHKKQVLNSEWNGTSCKSHWSCDLWEASLNQSHHMNIHDNSRLVSCQITADHWCVLFCCANERLQCLSDELLLLTNFFYTMLWREWHMKSSLNIATCQHWIHAKTPARVFRSSLQSAAWNLFNLFFPFPNMMYMCDKQIVYTGREHSKQIMQMTSNFK